MAERRPVVWLNGKWQQMPPGDTVAADTVPAQPGSTLDGGNFSTNHSGNLRIDLGSFT